jgi:acyl dehydratase
MLRYDAVKAVDVEVRQDYDERHTMLYALGVGLGADPLDEHQLRFVYERGEGERRLVALPTLADVLAYPAMWIDAPGLGIDWGRILHAGQSLRVRAPLPVAGTVVGRTRVRAVADKGPQRGALMVLERTLHDAGGRLLAEIGMTLIARGDGGFSAQPGNGPPGGDPVAGEPVAMPAGDPDVIVELPTLPQSALIYRLVADPNPLHADPRAARAAGFERPILHGLCAYGMAAHALVRALCGYDPARLASIGLRFSAPVLPGETLRFAIWQDAGRVHFRATVPARGVTVLDQGTATILP